MKESGPIFIYSMKTDDLSSNLIFGIDDDDETMKLEFCIIITILIDTITQVKVTY